MASADDSSFDALLEFDMDAGAIDEHWIYCDHIANFVARMVSHDRSDPFLYSNLLSASVNELLETAFRTRKEAGKLRFCFLRKDDIDRVELSIPCPREEQDFYRNTVQEIRAPDASEKYLGLLFSNDGVDRRIGLFELAFNFDAKIDVSVPTGEKLVLLTVELAFDKATTGGESDV